MLKQPLILMCLASASALAADTFDFAYQVQGEPRIAPLQVFDKGDKTYFQLRQGMSVLPAFFAVTTAGQILIQPEKEGQYLVIPRVEKQWALRLGGLQVSVKYVGQQNRDSVPAVFGAAMPSKITGQPPVPRPAALIADERRITPKTEVSPQESLAANETLIPPEPSQVKKDKELVATVASAQDIQKIAIAPNSTPDPLVTTVTNKTWELKLSDVNLKQALRRWCEEAGYKLHWELRRNFEITPAVFEGSLDAALTAVAAGYFESDSPFVILVQDEDPNNKSVRVLPYKGNRVTGAKS